LHTSSSFNSTHEPAGRTRISAAGEVAVVFILIEAALWTDHRTQLVWTLVALGAVLFFVFRKGPSREELGFRLPPPGSVSGTLLVTLGLAVGLLLAGWWIGTWDPRHPTWPPVGRPALYAAWTVAQEFLLQSFFFLHLEQALGDGRRAVVASAVLFSLAHLPSPALTIATLAGGLLFCEMFRRYRSLYLPAVAHPLLALTLAEAFSMRLLNHMRVGIGYVHAH
jgi:membrane protease YdiL (CAAX protease family)